MLLKLSLWKSPLCCRYTDVTNKFVDQFTKCFVSDSTPGFGIDCFPSDLSKAITTIIAPPAVAPYISKATGRIYDAGYVLLKLRFRNMF